MSVSRLFIACALAGVFSITMITTTAALFVLPLVPMGLLALVANFGPLGIAGLHFASRHSTTPLDPLDGVEPWILCCIVWIGLAYGLSDGINRMFPGSDLNYWQLLFLPWLRLFGF